MANRPTDVFRRLQPGHARRLVREALAKGSVAFSRHALDEMRADDIIENDVVNVLRCGQIFDPPDEINGTWRYRVEAENIPVVVAFRSVSEIRVVTAWRK